MLTPDTHIESPERVQITVVIPVKNDAVELARCLSALRLQTRLADEIIVVNNASSDASAKVAIAAGVTVIECSEPGIPAASSRGYDLSAGDLILRLDADCVPPTSWVEHVEAAFADHPDVAAFTGGAYFIDGPRPLRAVLSRIYLLAYVLAAAPALGHRPLFGSNFAMRREAWHAIRSAVHRHDPELHDDLDLSFHLGEHHPVGRLGGEPMGISMRPFRSVISFRRRMYRGFRTVLVHWPHDFPPSRWYRLATQRP
ncbi:glycosyltransferase family 2 protein [Microbacterium sp. A196]|uniref:glycosyltransferase family 2 protein n=1 Tax=Microbacterium sp. A196 TaxID=3457320 RepID=UPI003FD1F8DB